MSQTPIQSAIKADLASAGLAEVDHAVDRLERYLDLLARWNRTYNLTAIRDISAMRIQHLGDCIATIPSLRSHADPIHPKRVLDVGSGGGLPGVIYAILHPQWHVDCIDAVGKKAAFIRQVAGELALPKLHALHGRVEQFHPLHRYNLITSRAFSDLRQFVELTQHLLEPEGIWAAMKGNVPKSEIASLPPEISVQAIHSIHVNELQASRCLVILNSKR